MTTPTTVLINGEQRVIPEGAIAYKHAVPPETATWLYNEEDVEVIRRKDPSLLVEWKPAQVISLHEVEAQMRIDKRREEEWR